MTFNSKNTYVFSGSFWMMVFITFSFSLWAMSEYFNIFDARYIPPFVSGLKLFDMNHLGSEYNSIAQSLYNGQGFSNPFYVLTGSTAWMAPVLPFLIYLFYVIFKGHIAYVGFFVVMLTNVIIAWIGYRVITGSPTKRSQNIIIFVLLLFVHFYWFFQVTNDVWLNALLISLMYFTAVQLVYHQTKILYFVIWSVLGGISLLTNPAIGLVWCIVQAYFYFKGIYRKRKLLFMTTIILFLILPCIWTMRNYMTFNRFIPIKSNLFYDAYQANYFIPSGILDSRSFLNHPIITALDPSSEYRSMTEPEFSDIYKRRFLENLLQDPKTYLVKVSNRFVAMLFIYPQYTEVSFFYNLICSLIHALWGMSLILIFLTRRHHADPPKVLAILFIGIYLIPYALITFYMRYFTPLIGLQALVISWGLDSLKILSRNALCQYFPSFIKKD